MKTHILAISAVLAVAGCSTIKNPLERTLPDETQVLSSPSLALPPRFELRPPEGATPDAAASEALLRAPGSTAVSGTGADGWLVNQAQAQAGTAADVNIRADLEVKAAADTVKAKAEDGKQGLLKRWFGRK